MTIASQVLEQTHGVRENFQFSNYVSSMMSQSYFAKMYHLLLSLTIPDATECNSLKKVMDVVALCISVLAV